ncbi:uncharacterized protein [Drosophila pseudoobscura]|uniref:Uncharacterized protein n=1 Tax=Drosophila pseudoobscura pseudoobscura TaxID=46245 RepID=A0A6I8V5T9_DROPS|nr:uncharacterized protein LOC13036426 [Drosophila pseudoobscura]
MKLALVEDKAMGKEEINDSVSMVLDMVGIHGYSNRLMCILSDGCPANLLAKVTAAREYAVSKLMGHGVPNGAHGSPGPHYKGGGKVEVAGSPCLLLSGDILHHIALAQ